MATKLLLIDSDGRSPLFLSLAGGDLSVGEAADSPAVIVPGLRVRRFRCEVEVEEETITVRDPRADAEGELRPGQWVRAGHALLRFSPAPEKAAAPPPPAPPEPPPAPRREEAPPPPEAFKRLLVIDGADEGHSFRLPESGAMTLGKSAKHADIILHDLYVSRVHCEVKVDGDTVIVSHVEGENGTRVNGQRIEDPTPLRIGDVVRIGNSHMRYEIATPGKEGEGADEVEVIEEEADEVEVIEEEEKGSRPAITRLLQLEGQVLGHFRVGPLLGRGHTGVVFRGQDLKTNQVVALKVLSAEFPADGAELQRFVAPLKVVPHLHHPNLVTIHGAGRSGQHCWIAREYVEGESVARLVQRLNDGGKFNWARAGRVAVHLGRALQFLHQNKIVHGNLSPHNVLIRASDKGTKLADLMLMQALEGSKLQEAVLEAKLLAELPYLAPEQADAQAYVDHLADLYALGAVLYTILAGQPPFQGETAEELLSLVRGGAKAVRPSSYQRGIPQEFEAVVLKLLSKNQEDRYQTPSELLADVEPIAQEHDIEV